MTRLFGSLSVLSLCAASVMLGGCTAKSLKAFEGEPVVTSEDYTPGTNVTIQGVYGDIFVTEGESGVVRTTFKPFVYEGYDDEDQARDAMENNLDLEVSTSGDTTTISASRHDATNGLGSHITVELPEEFDGVLVVQNEGDGAINQGHIDVSFVGDATTLNVQNQGLENCNILRGEDDEESVVTNLTEVDVRCEADITVRGVRDNVFVHSKNSAFHSNMLVEIIDISAASTGGEIRGDNSSIEVRFPDAGDYDVTAVVDGPDSHINDLEPASCEVTAEDDTSADLTCGAGGPLYTVTASDDDDDDGERAAINLIVH
jgi:hypothetical protein